MEDGTHGNFQCRALADIRERSRETRLENDDVNPLFRQKRTDEAPALSAGEMRDRQEELPRVRIVRAALPPFRRREEKRLITPRGLQKIGDRPRHALNTAALGNDRIIEEKKNISQTHGSLLRLVWGG